MKIIERELHFERGKRTEKQIRPAEPVPQGRVPRISKLMALAIRFDELLRTGQVLNFSELADLGQVCRTRITQIMNLTLLAPEIQERLLLLPRVEQGPDPVYLKDLQRVAREVKWDRQVLIT